MKLTTNLSGGISGVYLIESPSGKQYIGSSCDIRRRWYEHHWRMKNGKSSSPQLDRCYAKHGLNMRFSVLEECDPSEMREREQFYLDEMKPELNVSKDAFCAAKWLEQEQSDPRVGRGREAAMMKRRCPVEDSMGNRYESITAAARFMNCSESVMRRRVASHDAFDCGRRFRCCGEDWLPSRPDASERRLQSQIRSINERRAAGRLVHSEEARRRKSELTRGVPWSEERRARYAKSKGAGQ